jgi:hypothetical protein
LVAVLRIGCGIANWLQCCDPLYAIQFRNLQYCRTEKSVAASSLVEGVF